MQAGGSFFSEPTPLPAPPALERVFFESGAWVGAGVLVVAALAALTLARRGRARLAAAAALAGVALAGGALAVSTLVETSHERILERARQLIDAVQRRDPAAADPIVHDSVRVFVEGAEVEGLDKPALLGLIGRARVDEVALLANQAAVEGAGAGVSQVQARATVESVPSLSWWRLDWRLDDAGAWVVVSIEPILVNGQRPGAWLAGEMRNRAR